MSDSAKKPTARESGEGVVAGAERLLAEALESDNQDERLDAAVALETAGTERSVESLIAALDDPDWKVQAEAARSLGSIGDERAVGPLRDCLTSDAWWVRANAAEALALLGGRGVEALRAALWSGDRSIREPVSEALAHHRSRVHA